MVIHGQGVVGGEREGAVEEEAVDDLADKEEEEGAPGS